MASAACDPPNHTFRIAGTLSFSPVKHKGTAGEQQQHYRFAGGYELAQQLALCVGDCQFCARSRFAAHVGAFAHCSYDDIGSCSNGQGLFVQSAVVAMFKLSLSGGIALCGLVTVYI